MLENFIRKYIKPPFWILEYRSNGTDRSETGAMALLANPFNRDEAEIEASDCISKRAMFNGEYFYSVRLAHWWERLY